MRALLSGDVCAFNHATGPSDTIQRRPSIRTFVSLSVDVLPQKLEYERTSTTVINAYVGPPVKHYVRSMVSMLHISDILIERHDLGSFAELVDAVRSRAGEERFLRIDVKPPFADTPDNWEDVLESAFTSATGR